MRAAPAEKPLVSSGAFRVSGIDQIWLDFPILTRSASEDVTTQFLAGISVWPAVGGGQRFRRLERSARKTPRACGGAVAPVFLSHSALAGIVLFQISVTGNLPRRYSWIAESGKRRQH